MNYTKEITLNDEPLKISICIPVYNGSKYLEQSILSALNQQFNGSYEILIADDCSQDNSFEIAQKFEKLNPGKIRLIKHEVNKGLTGNWNFCANEAKGEWIKFLFQDDLMVPDCLQLMYNQAMLDKSKLVICNRKFLIEENALPELRNFYTHHAVKLSSFFKIDRFVSPEDNLLLWQNPLLYNYLGEPSCYLYSREIVKLFGEYNAYLPQLCDYEYAMRIVSNIGFSYVNKELVTFRVSSSSVTSKNHTNMAGFSLFIEPLLLLHLFIWKKHYKNLRAGKRKEALVHMYLKHMEEINKAGLVKVHKLLSLYFSKFPFLHLHKWYFFKSKITFYFGRITGL